MRTTLALLACALAAAFLWRAPAPAPPIERAATTAEIVVEPAAPADAAARTAPSYYQRALRPYPLGVDRPFITALTPRRRETLAPTLPDT